MFNKLLETIEIRGISRYRLAKMAHIATSDMYHILSGKKYLFPAWKKRIAEALEMSEADLFPEENNHEEG